MSLSPKVFLYYTYYTEPLPVADFELLLHHVPVRYKARIRAYRKWEDRHAALLGKRLLVYALQAQGLSADLDAVLYTENDKPYIVSAPDFNITHSGNLVVVAISAQSRVGIDVERRVPVPVKDYEHQFSKAEWSNIQRARNKMPLFYEYWTRKEAILKADGIGLHDALYDMDVRETVVAYGPQEWFLTSLAHFPEYTGYLATSAVAPEVVYCEVSAATHLNVI